MLLQSLNSSEMNEYKALQAERSRPKTKAKLKSVKPDPDPVVDDSNVIETVDVSTSGANVYTSDESEEEDSEPEEVTLLSHICLNSYFISN